VRTWPLVVALSLLAGATADAQPKYWKKTDAEKIADQTAKEGVKQRQDAIDRGKAWRSGGGPGVVDSSPYGPKKERPGQEPVLRHACEALIAEGNRPCSSSMAKLAQIVADNPWRGGAGGWDPSRWSTHSVFDRVGYYVRNCPIPKAPMEGLSIIVAEPCGSDKSGTESGVPAAELERRRAEQREITKQIEARRAAQERSSRELARIREAEAQAQRDRTRRYDDWARPMRGRDQCFATRTVRGIGLEGQHAPCDGVPSDALVKPPTPPLHVVSRRHPNRLRPPVPRGMTLAVEDGGFRFVIRQAGQVVFMRDLHTYFAVIHRVADTYYCRPGDTGRCLRRSWAYYGREDVKTLPHRDKRRVLNESTLIPAYQPSGAAQGATPLPGPGASDWEQRSVRHEPTKRVPALIEAPKWTRVKRVEYASPPTRERVAADARFKRRVVMTPPPLPAEARPLPADAFRYRPGQRDRLVRMLGEFAPPAVGELKLAVTDDGYLFDITAGPPAGMFLDVLRGDRLVFQREIRFQRPMFVKIRDHHFCDHRGVPVECYRVEREYATTGTHHLRSIEHHERHYRGQDQREVGPRELPRDREIVERVLAPAYHEALRVAPPPPDMSARVVFSGEAWSTSRLATKLAVVAQPGETVTSHTKPKTGAPTDACVAVERQGEIVFIRCTELVPYQGGLKLGTVTDTLFCGPAARPSPLRRIQYQAAGGFLLSKVTWQTFASRCVGADGGKKYFGGARP
jgi:hypothetical protein